MTSYYTIAHQDADGGMHYPRWIDADDFVITDDEIIRDGEMLTTRDIRESSVWTSRQTAKTVADMVAAETRVSYGVIRLPKGSRYE